VLVGSSPSFSEEINPNLSVNEYFHSLATGAFYLVQSFATLHQVSAYLVRNHIRQSVDFPSSGKQYRVLLGS
jgi:hypothetical protein